MCIRDRPPSHHLSKHHQKTCQTPPVACGALQGVEGVVEPSLWLTLNPSTKKAGFYSFIVLWCACGGPPCVPPGNARSLRSDWGYWTDPVVNSWEAKVHSLYIALHIHKETAFFDCVHREQWPDPGVRKFPQLQSQKKGRSITCAVLMCLPSCCVQQLGKQ